MNSFRETRRPSVTYCDVSSPDIKRQTTMRAAQFFGVTGGPTRFAQGGAGWAATRWFSDRAAQL
jgi:hypothetical protein